MKHYLTNNVFITYKGSRRIYITDRDDNLVEALRAGRVRVGVSHQDEPGAVPRNILYSSLSL